MAKSSNKVVFSVALLLFLGGLGYLIFSGLTEDTVYFLNVSEVTDVERGEGKKSRLFGKVSPRNLVIAEGKLGANFDLLDKEDPAKNLRVEFKGALPDTFKDDVEVILEGEFTQGGTIFTARTLVTKCPSKYEEQSKAMEQKKG